MNPKSKELLQRIRAYFGEETNRVRIFIDHGQRCVDVEYEDFHSLQRVENDVRTIIGDDCLLNVKREYSERMMLDMVLSMFRKDDKSSGNNANPIRREAYQWIDNYEITACR